MTVELVALARRGDADAFGELVDPYRRELHLHCYRILGSTQEAEDALQETLVSAWRGMSGFQERASIRSWLYRIATTRCLNALRARGRRPVIAPRMLMPDVQLPEPSGRGEVVWLEPYPDVLLDELADAPGNPETRYETKEAVSLAFITALQLLPPRQRAVLILRDVLGFHAAEVATMLDSSVESVNSALKRARTSLTAALPDTVGESPLAAASPAQRELVDRFTRAFEAADVDGIVALLTEDVRLAMPPMPSQWQGRSLAAIFLATVMRQRRTPYRILPTKANGQPAFAVYTRDLATGIWHAMGLLVLTLAGDQISAITRFETSVLPGFGLPRSLHS